MVNRIMFCLRISTNKLVFEKSLSGSVLVIKGKMKRFLYNIIYDIAISTSLEFAAYGPVFILSYPRVKKKKPLKLVWFDIIFS